jgi:putative peptidoglycan lipid II flippase
VDVVLARRFLSELGVGAQSYFGWALRLCDFPQGIFVMALQTATLPSLALLVARNDHEEVAATFAFGMRLALFVAIPATVLTVVLSEPLVVALFQRGQFDAFAARETGKALAAQGVGIWSVAAVRQLVSVYYALGDTRTPVIVAAIDLAVFVLLALGLRGTLGHVGISLAVSGASMAQMGLLWILLRKRLPTTRFGEIASSATRTLAACLPASVAAFVVAQVLVTERAGAIARLLPGIAGTLTFVLVFFAAGTLFGSKELEALGRAIARRRRRNP